MINWNLIKWAFALLIYPLISKEVELQSIALRGMMDWRSTFSILYTNQEPNSRAERINWLVTCRDIQHVLLLINFSCSMLKPPIAGNKSISLPRCYQIFPLNFRLGDYYCADILVKLRFFLSDTKSTGNDNRNFSCDWFFVLI